MLRQRRKVLQNVKKLDAFPKTSEECVETTTTGGTFFVLWFLVAGWMVVLEGMYFMETTFTYTFSPDTDFTQKLRINVDLTVAMPCQHVGADVLDMTGQHVLSFGALEMEDTWWELDMDQKIHFEGVQRVNSYFRDQFHSIHEILWRSGYTNIFGDMPRRRTLPEKAQDACRVHGTLEINKVAGNFHITAGKPIPLPRGHAHLAVFMDDKDYNFTHRINKFSFGDPAPGIIHPLEGDEEVTDKNFMTFQYFVTVVPTHVNTYGHRGPAFQYSVSEQAREISHQKNSHGTPGIFFKYDVSALKVEVTEQHEPLMAFLTRLCGIVGGVFTCLGLLSRLVDLLVKFLTCRFFSRESNSGTTTVVAHTNQSATLLVPSPLNSGPHLPTSPATPSSSSLVVPLAPDTGTNSKL